MFIERRIQKILFAPEEGFGPGEKHVSLLWSEAVLFSKGSIDISPLRGEEWIVVLNY